jgi:hypothetical protein
METMIDASGAAEELEIERLARAARRGRGFIVAARRALVLARRYRDVEGPGSAREAACVAQALAWRLAARKERQVAASERDRPGLARTAPGEIKTTRRAG